MGRIRISSRTMGLFVRNISAQVGIASTASEGLIAASVASDFVLNIPSSRANSKTIRPLTGSRSHTLQLCAFNCAVTVRNTCSMILSGSVSLARASSVRVSASACPRANFSDAWSACPLAFAQWQRQPTRHLTYDLQILRSWLAWFGPVESERPQHSIGGGKNRRGPASLQPMLGS